MNQSQIADLIRIAATQGEAAALKILADQADEAREGEIDSLKALDEDGTGQDREGMYIYGCGEYDTVDSRGEPLRPLVNDAGEPYWM